MYRETLEQAGYEYSHYSEELGGHVLIEKSTNKRDLWRHNPDNKGYGLRHKHYQLEFVRGLPDIE